MSVRLLPGLLVAATLASAQSSGHFDLDVRKSGVLRLGKSHIDPGDAAARQRLVKNDEDHRELSRGGSATFVLFLDTQNRIRQANLTYVIPGTTVVRSVATTTDEIAKWFGDYHYGDGRLRLRSKGTYVTGAESPDEILSLAWDISVDAAVVEHRR
jgi:hypothetical protein